MIATFIGGGSQRLLSILRAAMAHKSIFDNGEIRLLDLNVDRAETMARLLQKTPECACIDCKISWDLPLEQALQGADVVGVILMPASQENHAEGMVVSREHGFLASDNISPNGTFLGIKGGALLLDIARKMEQHCPAAIMLNFANPTAIFSGLVNNHTRIKALGVCAGATNHQWDLMRALGKDEMGLDFDVHAAGVNHLSFILQGKYGDKDLFEVMDKAVQKGMPEIAWQTRWPAAVREQLQKGVERFLRVYRELGVLVFSTEADGFSHLCYDESLELQGQREEAQSLNRAERVKAQLRISPERRKKMDREFGAIAKQDLTADFWAEQDRKQSLFGRSDQDVLVKILRGLSGAEAIKAVSSQLNNGAVSGIKNRTVLEYSQIIHGTHIRSADVYQIPDVVYGLTTALAAHQTMIGDALANADPKLLAQALLSYPVQPFSRKLRELYKALTAVNRAEMPKALQNVDQYL